ncbi:MAG: FHA domain-containing protein [Planctomycetes bacterium]|nr:FHA domain-containing protein [Planctomycetota bacterium]NBY01022.1 FHA domain-containing protein [Planctomycetota bacterium]
MRLFLELLKDGKPKQRIVVKEGESYVGRAEDCKIRIPSSSVSRKHCKLTLKDRLAVVVDLQSVNGTFVNGVKISKSTILREGDLLLIGPISFRVMIPTSVTSPIKPVQPSKNKPPKKESQYELEIFQDVEPNTDNNSFGVSSNDGDSIIPIQGEQPPPKAQRPHPKKKKTNIGSDEFVELQGHNDPPILNEINASIRISDGANLRDILAQLDGLDENKH